MQLLGKRDYLPLGRSVTLRAVCLLLVVLFGNSTPISYACLQQVYAAESESPSEETETNGEKELLAEGRSVTQPRSCALAKRLSLRCSGPRFLASAPIHNPAGHRLSNGLCAPLRC